MLLCFDGFGVHLHNSIGSRVIGAGQQLILQLTISPDLSIFSFSFCFSNWLTESCRGRVVRLVLHIAERKIKGSTIPELIIHQQGFRSQSLDPIPMASMASIHGPRQDERHTLRLSICYSGRHSLRQRLLDLHDHMGLSVLNV